MTCDGAIIAGRQQSYFNHRMWKRWTQHNTGQQRREAQEAIQAELQTDALIATDG
jgi:hypothetical protein